MLDTKRLRVLGAIAAVSSLAVLLAPLNAAAQSTTCCAGVTVPSTPGPSTPTPTPTIPPAATIPTPPPVVIVTPTPPPPPPPVVDVRPTPPPGMWTNVPSDMRRLTQFDTITSINRLTEPGTVNFSIPRQAVRNKLENRTDSAATTGIEPARAIQVLESAKPLI